MLDNLSYDAKKPGVVTDLVNSILKHYELDSSKVSVKVLYEKIENVSGTYASNCSTYGAITIRIDPIKSDYDSIIATALHECAHYYMAIRKFGFQDIPKNEKLTDLTALYLGASSYYKRNYNLKLLSNIQPGYLDYDELQYSIGRIDELRREGHEKKHQFDLANHNSFEDATELTQKIISMEKQLCFDNLICEPETMEGMFSVYADLQKKSEFYLSMCRQMLTSSLLPDSELNKIEKQKKELKAEIESLYQRMKSYIALINEQKIYSQTVMAYLKNISRLAMEGNVFCLYEKLKFYCQSSKTLSDAKIVYEKIENHGTADSLFVLGKCYDEGVYVKQDKSRAGELYLMAAKEGSRDAQKQL